MQNIVLYLTDTMADWEYAYVTAGVATAEEQAPGRFRLVTAADGVDRVVTKGGLRVLADADLADLDPGDIALLLLPGADTWFAGHDAALALAGRLVAAGVPVAAICGATAGLARAGLLDERRHTSNAPEFLAATGYGGAAHYVDERVVDEGTVITAPATMPVDFAAAIFRRLGVFPPEIVDAWYGLFTTGEKRFFDALSGGAA